MLRFIIPKKVIIQSFDNMICLCPRCKKTLLRIRYDSYCSRCGQRLKYK